jgi:bifunctional polynucleotide phosphatase/kinase
MCKGNGLNNAADKSTSFFVGDAAGRQYPKGKGDFSSTDRKWAQNIGITFCTPEVDIFRDWRFLRELKLYQEYFLKLPPHKNIVLPGFRASELPQCSSLSFARFIHS